MRSWQRVGSAPGSENRQQKLPPSLHQKYQKEPIQSSYQDLLGIPDGVVLIDSDYLTNRKLFGQVVCSFRYGREEDECMGLNFQKDLYLCSTQIYPPEEKREWNLTKLQVK